MSELATPAGGSTAARPAIPELERQQSLLFPSLFKKLPTDDRLHVLDIGPAHNETIYFFSRLRCRLHFAGMYSEPLTLEGAGDRDPEALTAAFSEALAIPAETRFDLVLLWDYPNYLEDEALKAFSKALAPHLHERTLGHAFAVRTASTKLTNQWYGIDEPHLFTLRPPRDRQPVFHPHPQAILINLLDCFSIDRGMLLPDGRLEVAMHASID